MRENTTIGDAAPITMGGKLEGVEREKAESFVRAAFQRAAEANGYPPLLLKAMVTMQIEVYRVRNLETGQYEFFEGDSLPKDPNQYDVKGAEEIDGKDELLTLTAPQALEYGIARAVVKDRERRRWPSWHSATACVFTGEPKVLETSWSEHMVSWLNSPGVMAVLVMLALLGVYVEFSTPGFGLAGDRGGDLLRDYRGQQVPGRHGQLGRDPAAVRRDRAAAGGDLRAARASESRESWESRASWSGCSAC